METFLDFAKEILKGVVRAISAYYFGKVLRKQKKTIPRRRKQRDGSQNK